MGRKRSAGEREEHKSDELLRLYRKVVGAFETFHPARTSARALPSKAFARHVALDLSLDDELSMASVNPGWDQVTLHAFTLRPMLAAALNRRLEALALHLEGTLRGLSVSNVGAYHSKRLAPRSSKRLGALTAKLEQAVREAEADELGSRTARARPELTSLWCNVSRPTHYHGLHDHAGATWSGVYYVRVAPPPRASSSSAGTRAPAGSGAVQSGRLVFRTAVGGVPPERAGGQFATDPARPEGWSAIAHVDPQPGLLLLFPSWLEHCVLPVAGVAAAGTRMSEDEQGGTVRISFSFNFGERFERQGSRRSAAAGQRAAKRARK